MPRAKMSFPRVAASKRFDPPWLVLFALAIVASSVLFAFTVRGVFETTGREAVPLDDAFIHFQYARRIAEGDRFVTRGTRFQRG